MNTLYSQFDIAAIVLIGLVFVHSLVTAQQGTGRARLFNSFLAFSLACLVLDIVTVVMINDPTSHPLWLHYLLNTLFISLMFLLPALFASYVFLMLDEYEKRDVRIYCMLCVPAALLALATIALNQPTHWFFFFDEQLAYVHGPFFYLMFINVAFYVVVAVGAVVIRRDNIARSQRFALPFIAVIALAGVACLVAFPQYIPGGFAAALCLLVMYMTFQSPGDEQDVLTGLCTQHAFYQRAERLLHKNQGEPYVMAYVNVRRFKLVNGLFGEKAGDEFLVCIAEHLRAACASEGLCGRFAGDHFVLCLPDAACDIDAILAGPADGPCPGYAARGIVLVAGLYPIDDPDLPVNLMCDRARLALAEVDPASVCRHEVYDHELRLSMLREHALLEDMQPALDEHRFVLYYQPVYSLATGALCSAEVLVRWVHAEYGFLTPGAFIKLLERNGSIVALDRYVWKSACEQVARWQADGVDIVPLSVNVSRLNLLDAGFVDWMARLFEEHEVDPSLVKLEITESCYLSDFAMFLETINALRQRGFIVMMDDFGSAYSSLSALRDTNFDQLKIDMSFLADNDAQGHFARILASVIRLAQRLNMLTIAEGVETIEQARLLRGLGCDAVQGYLCARPMPGEDFSSALAGSRTARVLLP